MTVNICALLIFFGATSLLISSKHICRVYTKNFSRCMCQFWWVYIILIEKKVTIIYDIGMLVLKMMFHFILELFSNYSEKLSVKTWCCYQDSYCSNIKYDVTLSNMIIQNAPKERYNCFYWVLFYLFLSILNPYDVI